MKVNIMIFKDIAHYSDYVLNLQYGKAFKKIYPDRPAVPLIFEDVNFYNNMNVEMYRAKVLDYFKAYREDEFCPFCFWNFYDLVFLKPRVESKVFKNYKIYTNSIFNKNDEKAVESSEIVAEKTINILHERWMPCICRGKKTSTKKQDDIYSEAIKQVSSNKKITAIEGKLPF